MTESQHRLNAAVPLRDTDSIEDATVGVVLRRAAQQAPESIALVEGLPRGRRRRQWTYSQLVTESETAARVMLEHVAPGDKVAIWANNVPEWIFVQMGAALAGLTLVTVNPALTREEAGHVLRDSGAVLVFHVDEYRGTDLAECLATLGAQLPDLRNAIRLAKWDEFCTYTNVLRELPEVSPGDLAQIQYTSGTTGRPKGVELRHRGIVNNARLSFLRGLPGVHDAPIVSALPLFHTAGSVVMTLGAIQTRSTLVLMPSFDPALQLALIASERSVLFAGVPTMLQALVDHRHFARTDLTSITAAMTGGSLIEPALVARVEDRLGVPLTITYGQTECSPSMTVTQPNDSPDVRRTTVGRVLPGVELKIVDTSDGTKIVECGEIGEVCTRGYHVMAGYHNDPVRTADVIDSDGWLRTGDLASMDVAGNVRIEGRSKDMIIRGGENISPGEIETALVSHPAVAEAAVVGTPDPYWGEVVTAFVRLHVGEPVTVDKLQSFLSPQIAKYKIPQRWHFVSNFPLNASGKILKTELRQTVEEAAQQ
ncbi:hypothetical protein CH286_20785 [Rhodococcus sp. WWJCD1]|uniref:AMP-binding protein n=1 Tax=Rhodococcus sp. WWJCD1 TaxID=2022519 RepID=UPI000B9BE2F6|nr:AMP-binding protein [Rhodococcus sp. WWJCD1]OZC44621.1 hypothetical protein CH286_20785 [Rhodococcus sp. WWJCD1]